MNNATTAPVDEKLSLRQLIGVLFNRQAYVGLAGRWGALTVGHQTNMMFDAVGKLSNGVLFGSFYAFHPGNIDEFATWLCSKEPVAQARWPPSIRWACRPAGASTRSGWGCITCSKKLRRVVQGCVVSWPGICSRSFLLGRESTSGIINVVKLPNLESCAGAHPAKFIVN